MERARAKMKNFPIKRILVENDAENDLLTQEILKTTPGVPVEYVKEDDLAQLESIEMMDKESLRLIHYKGDFLKPCPGTSNYICCGYQILNVGINCPMDCSYCFLQSYVNQPSLRVFSNLEDNLNKVGEFVDSRPDKIFRIGTGEFTDSLALNRLTGWTRHLLSFFSKRKNCVLELKTKTPFIEDIVKSRHMDRIILAWSLNTRKIIAGEEHNTASLKSRILAAQKCRESGFALAFHFDPMIRYPGWEKDYNEVIHLLEKYIEPTSVIWISIGSLRCMTSLKWAVKRRFPETMIFDGEFGTGLDGKLRYFKPVRVEMYAGLYERLKLWHKDLGVYLCMESDDVWRQSFGWSPGDSQGLSDYLDNRVTKIFGEMDEHELS